MKPFLALLYFKGALLSDPDGILERQGPCVRAGYRVRLTSVQDVVGAERSIRSMVREAITAERNHLASEMDSGPAFPKELVPFLEEEPGFKTAFDNLTPVRQRGYVLHFSRATQSKTQLARIHKYRRKILGGSENLDR